MATEPSEHDGAIDRLGRRLHPAVVDDVRSWADDPALGKLFTALDHHGHDKSFLDTYAEVLVARHLRQRGWHLEFEVPTPRGRACDFKVTRGDDVFFLHVKRLDTDRPARRRLTISSRLRYLERIERPYLVSVRWNERASDEAMASLVTRASTFIQQARVGDELVVHDDDGKEIGGVLIVAPWEGRCVSLMIGLPSGFIDEVRPMRRLLQRAHRQFMPRAYNVIVLCSSQQEEAEDFDAALLGSLIERWDTFPEQGRRIAYGRGEDGLWHGRRYQDWRTAGWYRFAPGASEIDVRLRFRETPAPDPRLRSILVELFGEPGGERGAD